MENPNPQKQAKAKKTHQAKATEEIVLPLAEETERQVLTTLLLDQESIPKAVECGLRTGLFVLPSHCTIFSAFLDMQAKGWDISPKTLIDYLNNQHALERVGGRIFIAQLIEGTYAQVERLSGLIKQLEDIHFKRETTKKAAELQKIAGNGASPEEIEEFLDTFERRATVTQSYLVTSSGLAFRKPARFGFGFENERLTNFGAKIVAELIEDDGSAEEQRLFDIEVTLKGQKHRVEVPSSKFVAMTWPTAMLGAEAIIFPGAAEKAKCAIQTLSSTIKKSTVYAHTGWRQIGDDWHYLHGSGAMTKTGNRTDISVRLPKSLAHFLLPDPYTGKELSLGYRTTLDFLDAFPRHLTVPILGAVFGSVLGDPDYSVYVTGQSGCFKSEITGLAMSFFGAGFNRLTMPANWTDTANIIEVKAFTAKDALMVIDDFAPNGQKRHDDELHAKAERVFRAAGNRSGRGRLQADTSQRLAKEPRGLLLSSGEDLPRGMSLQARLLIVPIEKGEVNSEALSRMQQAARAGVFARAQSTFLVYLAANYSSIRETFQKDNVELRDKLCTMFSGHSRQPTTTAHLLASWRAWLRAAEQAKAITPSRAKELWLEIWETLTASGDEQKEHQGSLHPVDHFVELLRSALVSGKAFLATIEGDEPPEIGKICGWRAGQPQGECVGWIEDELCFLEPRSAYAAANGQGARGGEGLAVTERTLWKRMDERELIKIKEPGRGLKTRTPCTRIPCIAVPLSLFFSQL